METILKNLNIHRLSKTAFESKDNLIVNDIYLVDPEFKGGKLLETTEDGDIVESSKVIPTKTSELENDSGFITGGGGSVDIDNLSITENASGQIQTIGVVDQNNITNAIKTWSGTKEQYDSLATKDANTLYNITDDIDVGLNLLQAVYPVGSIYIGIMDSCPLEALFGTWTKVASDRVLQGAGTRGSAGTIIGESLPNIKGELACSLLCSGSRTPTGVFSDSYITKIGSEAGVGTNNPNWNIGTGGGESYVLPKIDASDSSTIYQDDAHVQQDAFLVNIWQRTA